jgi:hypothetical protein
MCSLIKNPLFTAFQRIPTLCMDVAMLWLLGLVGLVGLVVLGAITVLDTLTIATLRKDVDKLVLLVPTTGVPGATGAAGRDGAPGAPGARGFNGEDGAAGVNGAAGVDGAAGVPGVNGAAGSDGAAGSNGAAGEAGMPGAPGAPGADGTGFDWYGTHRDITDGKSYSAGDDVESTTVSTNGTREITYTDKVFTLNAHTTYNLEAALGQTDINTVYRWYCSSTVSYIGRPGFVIPTGSNMQVAVAQYTTAAMAESVSLRIVYCAGSSAAVSSLNA